MGERPATRAPGDFYGLQRGAFEALRFGGPRGPRGAPGEPYFGPASPGAGSVSYSCKEIGSGFELLNQGRVRQYMDLCGFDNSTGEIDIESVTKNLKALDNCIKQFEDNNGYVIIRTPCNPIEKHDITIENFKSGNGCCSI